MNTHSPNGRPPPLPPAPIQVQSMPPRLQTIITILLTHQDHICQYSSGTLIIQFKHNSVTAKLTNNLPLER